MKINKCFFFFHNYRKLFSKHKPTENTKFVKCTKCGKIKPNKQKD